MPLIIFGIQSFPVSYNSHSFLMSSRQLLLRKPPLSSKNMRTSARRRSELLGVKSAGGSKDH